MNNSAPCRRHAAQWAGRILTSVAVAASICVAAQNPNKQPGQEQVAARVETFALAPNGSVKVENYRGSVHAVAWPNAAVRVVAEKKTSDRPLLASDLILMSAGPDVVVKCNQTPNPDRIDLTVFMPAEAHLQITGGVWPVEVTGVVGSAVIQTTSGNIGYKLPASTSAHVALHSTRGVVRSVVPIEVDERAGLHTLQGSIGGGSSPIILDSKSGNITLLPGAGVKPITSLVDGQYKKSDLDVSATGAVAGDQGIYQYSPDQSQAAARRPQRPAAQPHSQVSVEEDRDEDSTYIRPNAGPAAGTGGAGSGPSRSSGQQYGPPMPSGGGEVGLGGSAGSTNGSGVVTLAGIPHPTKNIDQNENNMGIRVRIIPADATAGGAGDPRYPGQKSIDQLYAPDPNDPAAGSDADLPPLPGMDDPKSSKSKQSASTTSPSSKSSTSGLPDPAASSGGSGGAGDFGLAGNGSATNSNSVTKIGPIRRPQKHVETNENGMGMRVHITPADAYAANSADAGYPDRESNARPYPNSSGSTDPGAMTDGGQGANETAGGSGSGSARALPEAPPDENAGSPRSAAARANADDGALVLQSQLVSMNVSVTDGVGKTLPDLKQKDFKILEEGQPQEISFFSPTSTPFNLVLLLDLSGSVSDKIEVVKSAALHFLDAVGPEDKVAVVTFTRNVTVISQLTDNRELLRKRIKEIKKPEGGTAFYEAMWFTLVDTLRGTAGQRNAIVVLTDGVDNSLDRFNPAHTRVSYPQLARKLQASDCIVFPIYLDTEYEEVFERGNTSSEAYAVARAQLEQMATITGGRRYQAQKVDDLAGVYTQVADALRTVYSVGYYPTNGDRDGKFRHVSIEVDQANAVVRARKGYYAK